MKMTVITRRLYDSLLCMDWDYASSLIIVWHICSINSHSVIHNTEVPIAINNNTYFLSLNTNTTVFAWVDGNKNKNRT